MTDDILNLMDERKAVKDRDPQQYRILRKRIDTECKTAKETWWNKKCEDVELLEARNQHQEMHDKIKDVTGKRYTNKKEMNVSKTRMETCYLMKMKLKIDGKNM